MTWDSILFDFDGVLADTEPVHYACWKQILRPFGIELDWEFYARECIGVSDRLMIERLAGTRNPQVPFEEIWRESERKQVLFRERLEAEPPFLEETVSFVKTLSSTFKLGLVSSSGRQEVEPLVERAGIRHCFEALVCGREVPNLKPAPDPYLRAAELLRASKPLVVEDSDAGVASARAAGFDVLRISSPQSVARELRDALAQSQPPRVL